MNKSEVFKYEDKRLKQVIKKINSQIEENKKKFKEQENFIIGYHEGMRGTQFTRQSLMSFYAKVIEDYKSVLNNPYFGRFEFKDFKKNNEIFYIGKKAIHDENGNVIAYDWRSPICSVYYDYNIGPAEYRLGGQIKKGEITGKRQIIIKEGELQRVEEQDVISDDTILLKYLSETNDTRLKSIIATIQREQNLIIRSPLKNDYIIEGVAGSGKTTIALHRIAYLLYNETRNINESEFMILGPNKYFMNYISALLPELDIKNVKQTTFDELFLNDLKIKAKLESKNQTLQNILNGSTNKSLINYKSSLQYIKLIEKFVKFYISSNLKEPITYEGIELCSMKKLQYICNDNLYTHHASYKEKTDILIKEIIKRTKDDAADIHHEIWLKYRDEYMILDKESTRRKEILSIVDKMHNDIKNGCKDKIKEYFKFIKVNPLILYQVFVENIEEFADDVSIDVQNFKEYTLRKLTNKHIDYDDLSAIVLINYLINGNIYKEYSHLIIDEAQDLSLANYYVLKKVFPNAVFDIYGDLNQAIYNYSSINNWELLNDIIFSSKATILNLNKSYRTTKQISDISNLVLKSIGNNETQCVSRDGIKPVVKNYEGNNSIDMIIEQLYKSINNGYKNIAVICKDIIESKKVYDALRKKGLSINLVNEDNNNYVDGISVIPSYVSKGLEFDVVILYNTNNVNYTDDYIDQKLLYVAITRAMHELYINYDGEITNSLKDILLYNQDNYKVNHDKILKYIKE